MFASPALLSAVGLAIQLVKCSTLSRAPGVSPRASLVSPLTIAGQEHRLALHQKRTRKRRRRARCMHCAAVALAGSGRSIELEDDATPDGEVVLRDWLSRQETVEVVSSFEEQRGGGGRGLARHIAFKS